MNARDSVPFREESTDLTGYLDRLVPSASEDVYDRLTGYGFARRYVGGKTVADICLDELGPGSRLLAETAESVAGMAASSEAVEVALEACPAPNVSYERSGFSDLPYPEEHFDVVVALGVIEDSTQTEDLVRETGRVLKPDGVLVVSVPDRRVRGAGESKGMYVSELRELLERHFGHVRTYRQGAVAGGIVLPTSGNADGSLVESITLPPNNARPEAGSPTTRFILAVCSDTKVPEDGVYLLLDRDRRIFDEREDLAEDVELLRDEIENMQRTEVQAFRDSLRLRQSEIAYLRAKIRNSEARIRHFEARILREEAKSRKLEQHIHSLESSRTWRIFEPYRRLRSRLNARRQPESKEGSQDHKPG